MSSGFDFPEVSKVTHQNLLFLCSKEIKPNPQHSHNTKKWPKQLLLLKPLCADCNLEEIYLDKCGWELSVQDSILKVLTQRMTVWHGNQYSRLCYFKKKCVTASQGNQTTEPDCLYLSVKCLIVLIVLRFSKHRVVGFSHIRVTCCFINNLAHVFVWWSLSGWWLNL